MRAPLAWMAEYVALPADADAYAVAADLVRVGLEEEGVHGGDVSGPLVVGKVLEFVEEPQKNGKTIRWCQVDCGSHNNEDGSPRGIVCGAGNFEVGDLVVASLPGTVLPGGFAIAARKTYGHVSDGMICSARELGLGDDHDGIIRLNVSYSDKAANAQPGDDAIALLGLGEQTLEVNVTPDRGYAFSVRGIAREYSHATGAAFTDPADIAVHPASAATDAAAFAVELRDDAPIRGTQGCDRFVAQIVRGTNAHQPSPAWMQRRLEQVGMRPISLAVDVTNYVNLALGQPLHAYDLAKLQAPIVVRRAKAGEKCVTLDDVTRELHPEDLLITDTDGDRVLAIAGVMGGASSEVSESTTDILIEGAHFDPISVARSARRHKLSTEASKRFERGVDTDLADKAVQLCAQLIMEYGGGELGSKIDVDERSGGRTIQMSLDAPSTYVGASYEPAVVVEQLEKIGCTVQLEGPATPKAVATVTPPTWRPDLQRPVDLIEEVARLCGYDQIPSVLPVAPPGRGLTASQRARRSAARTLAERGLVEVLSYPFIAPEVFDELGFADDDERRNAIRLANPLSDEQPLMRTTHLPTLLATLRRNVGRGTTDLAIYEIGLVTRPTAKATSAPRPDVSDRPSDADLAALQAAVPAQPRLVAGAFAGHREPASWDATARPAAWSDAVEAVESMARALGVTIRVRNAEMAPWHPGRCAEVLVAAADGEQVIGYAGELHPSVIQALGLPARTAAFEIDLDALIAAAPAIVTAEPIATFPVAKEDIALIVDADVPSGDIAATLASAGGELLESVRLFDVYTGPQIGEGKASLAFSLRFRAADRTLKAEEVASARQRAVAAAEKQFSAVLRGA